MASLDKKYFQRLIESSPDIIIAVDKSGTVNYYNDGARTSLGYSSEEIIGEGCTRIYKSIDEARRVMKAMRESADKCQIASFETEFRNKAGELIPVMITGSLIHDDDGNEIGSIGFARDIRRLRHAQQLATAGEIAVSLAHEINNPLESITNNLELLSQSLETHLTDAEKVVENERLDSIRTSLERVQAIVRRLDEMTRKGEYETRDYLAGKRMADLAPRNDAKAHVRPHDAPHLNDQSPLAGMSVLVLDDDTAVVNSMADLLRAEKCIVHCATRPSAAFGILRNVRLDAVISDVVMPEMDGYDFYLKVKEDMPQLPVILMTAYYYDKDHILKRSRLRGLEGALFKKPVNPGKLRLMLSQLRQKAATEKAEAKAAAIAAKSAAAESASKPIPQS
ncbi:MAG TPA: PAS domain S-box protein [Candidatus Binataceae bacterium]|nr:PAS domain S-box protein [Candidatus Binataceae bacterium]